MQALLGRMVMQKSVLKVFETWRRQYILVFRDQIQECMSG